MHHLIGCAEPQVARRRSSARPVRSDRRSSGCWRVTPGSSCRGRGVGAVRGKTLSRRDPLARGRHAGAHRGARGAALRSGGGPFADRLLGAGRGRRPRCRAGVCARGQVVLSNAKNFRMEPDVPLVIPEVNASHLGVPCAAQRARRGWSDCGAIVTNANCAATGALPGAGAVARGIRHRAGHS